MRKGFKPPVNDTESGDQKGGQRADTFGHIFRELEHDGRNDRGPDRGVLDFGKLLPVLGVFLFLLPLIWPQSGSSDAIRMSSAITFIFICWSGLIIGALVFSRLVSRQKEPSRKPPLLSAPSSVPPPAASSVAPLVTSSGASSGAASGASSAPSSAPSSAAPKSFGP